MRFCPWYPLARAADLAPAAENVLQLRLASGLSTYPRGASAMVCYRHALDARAAAAELANLHPDADFVCRHLIELPPEVDLVAFCAKLTREFARRFGREPSWPTP
jgi:hypothetical protein